MGRSHHGESIISIKTTNCCIELAHFGPGSQVTVWILGRRLNRTLHGALVLKADHDLNDRITVYAYFFNMSIYYSILYQAESEE